MLFFSFIPWAILPSAVNSSSSISSTGVISSVAFSTLSAAAFSISSCASFCCFFFFLPRRIKIRRIKINKKADTPAPISAHNGNFSRSVLGSSTGLSSTVFCTAVLFRERRIVILSAASSLLIPAASATRLIRLLSGMLLSSVLITMATVASSKTPGAISFCSFKTL